MAELADAPDLGSGSEECRFKSCYPHQNRGVRPKRRAPLFWYGYPVQGTCTENDRSRGRSLRLRVREVLLLSDSGASARSRSVPATVPFGVCTAKGHPEQKSGFKTVQNTERRLPVDLREKSPFRVFSARSQTLGSRRFSPCFSSRFARKNTRSKHLFTPPFWRRSARAYCFFRGNVI